MTRQRISKGAFEGLLHLQKLDAKAEAEAKAKKAAGAPKRKKAAVTIRENQTAETAHLANAFAVLSGQNTQELKKRLGTLSDIYDWERGVYVSDYINTNDAFGAAHKLNNVFEALAKTTELALCYNTNATEMSKPKRIVIGYWCAPEKVSADIMGQCMPMAHKEVRARIQEASKRGRSSDPHEMQKSIATIYGEAPGISLPEGLLLMRRPLGP